jgi:hypothetical protein
MASGDQPVAAARTEKKPWVKRLTPYVSLFLAAAGAVAIAWSLIGDMLIIPRAEADKVHRAQQSKLDKHERAIRHQTALSSTMDENVRAIGDNLGVQMKPAPQPDMLADD